VRPERMEREDKVVRMSDDKKEEIRRGIRLSQPPWPGFLY